MKDLITKLSSRRICWLTGCFVLGVAKFSWASVLSRDTPEKRKWDHTDLVLGKGVRSATDISILPSKHSIVGPLSFFGLLNSFVANLAMALVFAFSMSSSNFSIILELMKHVETEFFFLDLVSNNQLVFWPWNCRTQKSLLTFKIFCTDVSAILGSQHRGRQLSFVWTLCPKFIEPHEIKNCLNCFVDISPCQ